MNELAHAAVANADTTGLTITFDLAERGARVTLFKCSVPGRRSMSRAAGVYYDAYAKDIDAAAAESAMDRFRSLPGEDGFAFHETLYVFLVRGGDDAAAVTLEKSVERARVHDRVVSLVGADELNDRFPIRTNDVLLTGAAENTGWADSVVYVDLFVEQRESAGVVLRVGDAVTLRTDPPAAIVDDAVTACFDAVVVTTGAHSRRLLVGAGHPIAPKPYRARASVADYDYRGPTVYDAADESYLRPHPGGVLTGDSVKSVKPDPDD